MLKFLILLSIMFVLNEPNQAAGLEIHFQRLIEKPEYKSWSDLIQKDMVTEQGEKKEMWQRGNEDLRQVINQSLTKLKNVYSIISRARNG